MKFLSGKLGESLLYKDTDSGLAGQKKRILPAAPEMYLFFEAKMYGTKRDEVTGEWRRLRNEELNARYSLSNIIRVIKLRRMRWVGHVTRMGDSRGEDRILVGKADGERPLERPRLRWEDNIKMDLQDV
jgi:hypothetical protein